MKQALLQRIFSLFGTPILCDNDIVYTNPPSLTDLEANGLVTKTMLIGAAGPIPAAQITTPITGGTTPNPIIVIYNGFAATGAGTTSAADGTVTNQATVTITGIGSGAKFTVVTVSHIATVVTQTKSGTGYNNGDTFTIATLPGITFTVSGVSSNPMVNPSSIYRNADGSEYAGVSGNIDDGANITLTGDDDGTGHFADSFSFVIKP